MNPDETLLATAQEWAEYGLTWAIAAAGYAGLLAMVVLMINVLFRRWLSARQMGLLWAVVLLRLLIPFAPSSAFSLQHLLESAWTKMTEHREVIREPDLKPTTVATSQTVAATPEAAIVETGSLTEAAPPAIDFWAALELFAAALPLIWLFGGPAYLLWTMIIHWRFCRRLKRVAACDDPRLIGLWDACRQQAVVRRRIPILPFDGVQQPAILGLFRPKLLLPTTATELNDQQLRMVMLHELAHVRRWDIAVNWALVVLRAIHWWNPVYWLAAARFQSLREQSCDAFAIQRIEGQPIRSYSELLLVLAQRTPAGPRWRIRLPVSMLGFFSSFFRKRAVGNRLKALRTAGVTRGRWHTAAVAGLVGLVSVCGLTDASTPVTPPDRTTVWESRSSHQWDWNTAPSVVRTYDIEKALNRIAVDARTKDQARVELTSLLIFLLKGINGHDPDMPSWMTLNGTTLTVKAPVNAQAETVRLLNAWEQNGQSQICIEPRLITDERDIASTIGVSWRYLEALSTDREEGLPAATKADTPIVRAKESVGDNYPVAVAVLNERQVKALTQAIQRQSRGSLSTSSKTTTFNGQPASMFNGTHRPFVVGTQEGTAGVPQLKIAQVDEGLQLNYRATQTSSAKQVRLEAQVELSEIGEVRTAAMLLPGEPRNIQLPRVKRSRIDVSAEVREGQSLLIGCVPTREQQEFCYVLLTVHGVWTDAELNAAVKPKRTQTDVSSRPVSGQSSR